MDSGPEDNEEDSEHSDGCDILCHFVRDSDGDLLQTDETLIHTANVNHK